jgi:hypothetical protein
MESHESLNAIVDELLAEMEQAGGPISSDLSRPSEILLRLADALGHVLDHSVPWQPDSWVTGVVDCGDLDPGTRGAVDSTLALLRAEDPYRVSRRQVFRLASAGIIEPVSLFVAVMVWGHGSIGYGWWRTREIMRRYSHAEFNKRLTAQIAAARQGAAAAWDAWTVSDHLQGMSTAFASKVAYFAVPDQLVESSRPRPLIADRNTAWAIWALTGLSNTRTQKAKYRTYVQTLDQWARPSHRADALERALFRLGPFVIDHWEDRYGNGEPRQRRAQHD